MIDIARLKKADPEILEDIRQGMSLWPNRSVTDEEISRLSWAEAMEYWLIYNRLDDLAEGLFVALRTLRDVGDDSDIEEDQRRVGDWIEAVDW